MKHDCKARTHLQIATSMFLLLSCAPREANHCGPGLYESQIRGVDGQNLHLPNTEVTFSLIPPVVKKTGGAYLGRARLLIGFENQSKDDTLRVDTNDITVL